MVRGGGASASNTQSFIDKAFEMKRLAESTGDQSYGAIIVRGNEVVGLGPSPTISLPRTTTAP